MASLRITSGPRAGEELPLEGELVIGRDPSFAQLVLEDDLVSREHARIKGGPRDTWIVSDLNSTNGTFVTPANGPRRRITEDYTLRNGDRLGIGSANLEFVDTAGDTVVAGGVRSKTASPPPPVSSGSTQVNPLPVGVIGAVIAGVAVVGVVVLGLVLLLSGGGDDELTGPEVLAKLRNSTVLVMNSGSRQFEASESSGSGIVLDDEGHILTNNHVVEGFASLSVQHPQSGAMLPAQIVGRSPCDDLAVIKVQDAAGFEPATLSSSGDLTQGVRVYEVGFPAGEQSNRTTIAITDGSVTRLGGQDDYYGLLNVIQVSNPSNPGNSGGPLADSKGKVVGVVYAGALDRQNANFAIAAEEADRVSKELLQGKNLSWIGLNTAGYYDGILEDLYGSGLQGITFEEEESALLLTGVATESPLYNEWFEGDVLTFAEGKPLSTPADLCAVIRSHRSGDRIEIRGYQLFIDTQANTYEWRSKTQTITLP